MPTTLPCSVRQPSTCSSIMPTVFTWMIVSQNFILWLIVRVPWIMKVHSISSVLDTMRTTRARRRFIPFYAVKDIDFSSGTLQPSYYIVRREQRRLSTRQRRRGPRSSYIGTEAFFVDRRRQPRTLLAEPLAIACGDSMLQSRFALVDERWQAP